MPLLDEYLTRRQLAIEVNRDEKTVARWETLPDGLPYTTLGKTKLYRKASVLAWLERREQIPNARRSLIERARIGREAAEAYAAAHPHPSSRRRSQPAVSDAERAAAAPAPDAA